MKLIDLALRQRWAALAARAESHPHEIFDVDENSFTALHWACFNQPDLRAVRAILYARLEEGRPINEDDARTAGRQSATMVNVALMTDQNEGMTALHAACSSHASVEVIFELVRCCPASVMVQDRSGWTPLHFLMHTALSVMEEAEANYTVDVARILIRAEPYVVLCEDRHGNSALECFVDLFGDLVKHDWTMGGRVPAESADRWFWSVASLLIREAGSQYRQHNLTLPIHSNADLHVGDDAPIIRQLALLPPSRVSSQLIPYVAAKFPDQLKESDVAGNLALHIAAGAYCVEDTGSSNELYGRSPDTIRALIHAYPTAIMALNRSKQLPLTVAIRSGRSWEGGVKSLVEAAPEGLQSCTIKCYLYPYILGRMASGRGETSQTSLFKLLRSKPDLAQVCPSSGNLGLPASKMVAADEL